MNKTNFKIELLQKMVAFLNETVVNEDETKDSKQDEQPSGEEMKVPVEVYTIELDGEETVLNIYDDHSIEPAVPDGKYAILDEENKGNNAVIEGGKFAGVEPISEPSSEPVTPTIQEEEKKEEEPEDKDAKISALESSVAEKDAKISELESKISELEAKIAELESALADKDAKILEMSKEPSTKPVVTRKDGNGTDGRIAAFGKKFI